MLGLIIVTTADNLLHSRPQENGVLELGSVTALDVDKGRIRFDNAAANQVVQAEQVLLLTKSVQITSAKWQSTKALLDDTQKVSRRRDTKCHVGVVGFQSVVRALEVICDIASSSRPEGFDGENFTLLHLGLIIALDDRYGLATVDAVLNDVVTVEVSDRLDWVRLAVKLKFV